NPSVRWLHDPCGHGVAALTFAWIDQKLAPAMRGILFVASIGLFIASWVGWHGLHKAQPIWSMLDALKSAEEGKISLVRVSAYVKEQPWSKPLLSVSALDGQSLDQVPPEKWEIYRGAHVRLKNSLAASRIYLTKTTKAPESPTNPFPLPL